MYSIVTWYSAHNMAEDNSNEEPLTSGEQDVKQEGSTQDEAEAPKDTDMTTIDADLQDEENEKKDNLDKLDNDTMNEDDHSAAQGINLDGANDMATDHDMPTLETRLPAKKDVALRDFLSKMDDYAPIVRLHIKYHIIPNTYDHHLQHNTSHTTLLQIID